MSYMAAFNYPEFLDRYIQQGFKIVDISEAETNPKFLKASLLLPPYEAISELINGNVNDFRGYYFQYLASKECDYFLCAIYTAMINGSNIALFVNNQDEIGKQILESLVCYLYNSFGIIPEIPVHPETPQVNPFQFNDKLIPNNLDRIYAYDMIDANLYLMFYPGNGKIHTTMLPKLIHDLKPWVMKNTADNYVDVLTNLKNQMHESGRFLSIPILSLPEEFNIPEEVRNYDSVYW